MASVIPGMDPLVVSENCYKPVSGECIGLNSSGLDKLDCFGIPVDYSHTSVDLVTDANTLKEARDKLLLWSGLKSVPKCWQVIQPLLCSLYIPKCENGTIHLPDRSLCQQTRSPCKIVEIENGWPDFMLCDNNEVFADQCPNAIDTKFNESACEKPLMQTNNPSSWYEGVEGCGLQCMNPLFGQEEHDDMHAFIAVWASITTICTLFAMLSFFIDWKNSSRYPARIIFYINVCFFLCTFGWLAQFFQDSRSEIVCRRDGTARLGEPVGHDESPSCVIIFVFVYFFVMAGVAWFVVLSYSWKAMFTALGTSNEPLKGKTLHFHLFAWCTAFVLLIASLAVSEIDGDSMSGICFVGYKNHWYRMGLLMVPIGLMLTAGGFYLFGGLHSLLSLKHGHDGLLSENAVSKITWTMIRIGLFALFAFVFVLVTFASHVYQIVNQPLWDRSFRDYIRCEANITILEKLRKEIDDPAEAGECHIANRPNIGVMKLHLFAMFGTGIVMSTWVWTKASFMNWRRAWFKLIGKSDNEMKRIRRKSKIIAKAFANRHVPGLGRKRGTRDDNEGTDNDGFNPADLEFSEHTLTHQDPLGMDFDLNSVSQELSSNWVRNVPKMVRRRGAIMPQAVSSNNPSPTQSALDVNNADLVWATDTTKSPDATKHTGNSSRRSAKIANFDGTVNHRPRSHRTPGRLPPVKSRRGAMVSPPDFSAEPERASTQQIIVTKPQIHNQIIPGLVGDDSNYQITPSDDGDDIITPYSTTIFTQPHFPISGNEKEFSIPRMSKASHDDRSSLSSTPYNLRPSTRERSNMGTRDENRKSDKKTTRNSSSVMRQAW